MFGRKIFNTVYFEDYIKKKCSFEGKELQAS